jgi:hypothetical protein
MPKINASSFSTLEEQIAPEKKRKKERKKERQGNRTYHSKLYWFFFYPS